MKKGFRFTLMVVGESGLGKSTLIHSLFGKYNLKEDHYIKTTTTIETTTMDIEPFEERGLKLHLTVVDTPGFGDSINCTKCWQPIVDFINAKYDQYFDDESGFNRPNIEDNRVHCCLYFLSPNSHGLKPLDVQCMKALDSLVNIIPIIAKADTCTEGEIQKQKSQIMKEIIENQIKIYNGAIDEDEDTPEIKAIMNAIPMAVVGSTTFHKVGEEMVRGRVYPWGLVQVENKDHCDFILLQMMLIHTHMQDLKDCTQDIHYESFRKQKLKQEQQDLQNFVSITSGRGGGQPPKQDDLLKQKEREVQHGG
jgi:septin family protein